MAIETWNKPVTEIDNTYGYNDMLFVPGNASMPVTIRDRLSETDVSGASNPSGAISDFDAERVAMPGDQLYRLPNGGLLLRRSVFTETCQPGSSRPTNSLLLSEPMSRALAFFGASYQGSDPSGDLWCRRAVPGTAGNIETPWDLSSMGSLRSIEEVLGRIERARDGRLPSDLQPAQEKLAKELAAAVRPDELKTLSSDISMRIDRLKSAGDLFMKHPVLHTLGIAILFGLGTDVYHLARFALFGGENPLKSGGKGLFTRLIKGIRDYFKKDPPQGGSGGGGGGVNRNSWPTEALPELPQQALKDAIISEGDGRIRWRGKPYRAPGFKREVSEDGVISGEVKPGAGDDTVLTPLPDFVHDWENEPTREWVALPEGVIPLDEGAFISRYQATINGNIVGLNENVARNLANARGLAFDANSFFSAGDFTYGEFMKLAQKENVSADETVRSLNLKGPKAIATGGAVRLSTKDEAAAMAADRMRSGSQGVHVNGFGAQGGSVGVEVPVIRVVPVPVAIP